MCAGSNAVALRHCNEGSFATECRLNERQQFLNGESTVLNCTTEQLDLWSVSLSNLLSKSLRHQAIKAKIYCLSVSVPPRPLSDTYRSDWRCNKECRPSHQSTCPTCSLGWCRGLRFCLLRFRRGCLLQSGWDHPRSGLKHISTKLK